MTEINDKAGTETPMRDHLSRLSGQLRKGWRLLTEAPPGECAGSAYGSGKFGVALADIIDAALPHLGAGGVAVRELEWEEDGCPDAWRAQALPLLGSYVVFKDGDKWSLYFARLYCWHHESLEAAKAAAQADYEQRIRSALVPSPVPQEAGKALAKAVWGVTLVPQEATAEPVALGYTNWRGEFAVRRITPARLWYGSTEWHPEPQWLLTAFDHEKHAERDFALSGFASPPSHDTELLAALKPFADEAGEAEWSDEYRQDWKHADDGEIIGSMFYALTFGAFRKAHETYHRLAALAPAASQEKKS